MQPMKNNRGSAFILVVGMMVALAMIGTVFFMITRSDSKESLGAAEAAPMRSVAQTQVDRIAQMLVADLHIGTNGPYSGSSGTRGYIDYASPDPNDNDDAHLAATEVAWADGVALAGGTTPYPTAGRWPQISNIVGYTHDPTYLWVKNVDPDWQSTWDAIGGALPANWVDPSDASLRPLIDVDDDGVADAIPYVDTDGDDVNDAILYPTGIFDRNGDEYFAAVRVVDLSAMVNVNTAWYQDVPRRYPSNFMPAVPMTTLQLQGIGMSAYRRGAAAGPTINPLATPVIDSIHRARCGGSALTKDTFTWEAALRAENPSPSNDYQLFGWGDEMALRWRQDAAGANSRIETAMGADSAAWLWHSRFLTTGSSSRDIPRVRPSGTPAWRAPLYKVDLNLPLEDALGSALGEKQLKLAAYDLYRRAFYHMLADISDGAQRRRMAAQLAINLIDYRDADDIPSCADVPNDSGSTEGRVFGVERQPFLVEAWAKVPHLGNGDHEDDTSASDMALVLYNPYDTPIDISNIAGAPWRVAESSPNNYTADLPGDEFDAGEWYVIHTNGVNTSGVDNFTNPDVDDALSRVNGTIRLTRPALDLNDPMNARTYVAVAVAVLDWKTYFGAAECGGDGSPGVWRWHLRRDDRAPAHRAALEAYLVQCSEGLPTVPDYTAGDTIDGGWNTNGPNGLDPDHDLLSRRGASAASPALRYANNLLPAPVFVRGHSDVPYAAGVSEHRMLSVGELGRLLTVGPRGYDQPLDRELTRDTIAYDLDTGNWTRTDWLAPNFAVGRLDSWRFESLPSGYPDVPVLCLAADFFTTDSPFGDHDTTGDSVDNDGDGDANPTWAGDNTTAANNRESVVHGRININTAPLDVLCALPLLEENAPMSAADKALLRLRYAADLVAYRDGLDEIWDDPDTPTVQYNNVDFVGSASNPRQFPIGLPEPLRTDLGFAAAGEPAILLRARYTNTDVDSNDEDYVKFYEADDPGYTGYLLGASDNLGDLNDDGYDRTLLMAGDLSKYERRYTYLANLLTVNSDTYCAYIWVQLGPELRPATYRRYIAILDRSNCIRPTDRPQVRAFMEVK